MSKFNEFVFIPARVKFVDDYDFNYIKRLMGL